MKRPEWQGLPVKRFSSARCEVVLEAADGGDVVRPLTKYEALCFMASHSDLDVDQKAYGPALAVNAPGLGRC